jgi:hypothetical protein
MDRAHDLLKLNDEKIPFLGSLDFRLEFKPHLHQVKPKNIKISSDSENGATNLYDSYPTEIVFQDRK